MNSYRTTRIGLTRLFSVTIVMLLMTGLSAEENPKRKSATTSY